MKKLVLGLMAAAAISGAFTANASDYYLIGGFNGWALKDAACLFTDQGNGTYVLNYQGTLTSGFKINDGTWSNDAANWGGNATLVVGQTYSLTASGSSGNIPLSENIVNPKLTFNPTAATLLIEGQTTAATYKYGIHGNWYDSNWSTTDMTEANGKWILSNATVPAGQFGIKQMDASTNAQTSWISSAGDGVVVLNQAMSCQVEGTNFSNPAGTFTITFDPDAMTLLFEGEADEDDNPGVTTLYMIGDVNGYTWNPLQGVEATSSDNNVYTFENISVGSTGYFGFTTKLGTSDSDWATMNNNRFGAEYDGYPVAVGGPFTMSKNENSWQIATGEYTFVVDLNKNELTIQGDEFKITALYMIGSMNDFALTSNYMLEETQNGSGVFTGTFEMPEGDLAFRFFVQEPTSWISSYQLGAGYDDNTDIPVTLQDYKYTGEYTYPNGQSNWSVTLPDKGDVVFIVDMNQKTMSVDISATGVDSLESAVEGPEVIYNLQGVKVNRENVAPGIYIVNGKKTVIR